MKFLILALATVFFPGAFADPGKLDLKPLGFPLWGKHGEGDPTDPQGKCPLGSLPDRVFLHKTFKKGEKYFTWVRPVHNMVNEVVCDNHPVWKGADKEVLLDLHFVGEPKGKKFLHLELLHPLGGPVHVFLKFDPPTTTTSGTPTGGTPPATPPAPKPVGMPGFVVGVLELMPGLPDLEGLPAHHLMHALKLHSPPPVPAGPAPLGPSPV